MTDVIAFERLRELALVVRAVNRRVDDIEATGGVVGPKGDTGASAIWITGTLGNGADDEITISHGLGTFAVGAHVWRNEPPYERVIPDISTPTVNSITFGFAAAPEAGEFGYAIYGPTEGYRAGDVTSLFGDAGELRFTIEIKRAETGEVETHELVGKIVAEDNEEQE